MGRERRPGAAGRDDGVDAARAGRIPAQGDRQTRPVPCRRDAAGDRHAAELAAHRPRTRDQGGPADVPVCCTFQGEELFLESLGEPYRAKSLELIRTHAALVDAFIAVSRFGADQMAGYLGLDSIASRSSRWASISTATRSGPAAILSRSQSAIWGASRRRKACTCSARHIAAWRRAARRSRQPDSGRPATWARASRVPGGHRAADEGLGARVAVPVPRRARPAGQARLPRELSVLSVPGDYEDRKGCSCLESMASGVPIVQPAAGRGHRDHRDDRRRRPRRARRPGRPRPGPGRTVDGPIQATGAW